MRAGVMINVDIVKANIYLLCLKACCNILTTFNHIDVINILDAISFKNLIWPFFIFILFAHVIGLYIDNNYSKIYIIIPIKWIAAHIYFTIQIFTVSEGESRSHYMHSIIM